MLPIHQGLAAGPGRRRARISPATGRPYGVERVCRVWGVPRSSFYAQRGRAEGTPAQYVADDFRNQVRAWGMAASYTFVAEPQTNGVSGSGVSRWGIPA